MSWVLRFVTSTEASRTTRLDLNDPTADPAIEIDDLEGEGQLDFGSAEIERTMADPEGRDGQVVTSSKRPNREVQIPLLIHGTGAEFAAAMSALSRECDRSKNFLEWCPDGADPVFFVVRQGVISTPDTQKAAAQVWTVDLTLLCDPAALGPLESGTTASLSNNPASGQEITMPTIKGDVAAPLTVRATWTRAEIQGVTVLVNSHAHESASRRWLLQAENADLLTNGAALSSTGNTAMSGTGTNHHVRIDFSGTASLLPRIKFNAPFVKLGHFKVLARVRKTVASDVFTAHWNVTGDDLGSRGTVNGQTVTYGATATVGPHYLDLGTVGVPTFGTMADGTTQVKGDLYFNAGRTSGSGMLDVDCLLFVPVEVPDAPLPKTSFISLNGGGIASTLTGIELQTESDAVATIQGTSSAWTPPVPGGGFPMVYPGFANFLTVMRHVGTVGDAAGNTATDQLSDTTAVSWSYNPRWLFVAPPS